VTTPTQASLFEVDDHGHTVQETYSVHCFFNCGHVTRAGDPDTSGAAMEQHYTEQHSADIDRALGFIGRKPRAARP
jgi:hypothetical protein